MPIKDLLSFMLVYALAVASPGPGVAAIVARGLSRGGEGALSFVLGFTIGDVLWISLVTLGLAAAAQAAGDLFVLVRYAGALYLLYTAYQMWSAKPQVIGVDPYRSQTTRLSAFLGGFSLTLGNPKSMVFFLVIVPTLVPLKTMGSTGLLQIFVVVLLVNPLVLGSYAVAAVRAQRLFRDPNAMRIVNRVFAVSLAAVAILVAFE